MSWKKQFDEAKKKRFPMEEKSSKKSVRKINENIKAKKRGNFLIVTIDGVEYKAWMWGASAIKKDVLDKLKADGNWLIEVEGENASRGYIANGLLKLSPYYKGDDYLKSKVVKNALIDKVKEYHKKQFEEAKKKRFPMEEKSSKKLNEGKLMLYIVPTKHRGEYLSDAKKIEYAEDIFNSMEKSPKIKVLPTRDNGVFNVVGEISVRVLVDEKSIEFVKMVISMYPEFYIESINGKKHQFEEAKKINVSLWKRKGLKN